MPSPADSAFERHHDSWPAFHQYLDGYCSKHGVNIGVAFSVSAAGRNRDLCRSKRAAQGKETVELLPAKWGAYRRTYVCRLGRKPRSADTSKPRYSCPFRFTVKSVRCHGTWHLVVTAANLEHDHTADNSPGGDKRRVHYGVSHEDGLNSEDREFYVYDTCSDPLLDQDSDVPTQTTSIDKVSCEPAPGVSTGKTSAFELYYSLGLRFMENIIDTWGQETAEVLGELPAPPANYSEEVRELVDQVCSSGMSDEIDMGGVFKMLRKTQSWFVAVDDLEFENRGRFYEDSSCEAHSANWHGQQVTVKRVELKTNGDRARFVSEVETWHRLNHPHVVRLFGACDASPAFLVWENLEFRPLMSYVCQQQRRIWKTLYEAALGLQYLHSTHVLHGDLRGDNILVGSNEISKLGYFNFDLVEPSAPESEADARTVSKNVRWVAPEVLLYGKKLSCASDIYSFGMSILEIASGEIPWGSSTPDSEIKTLLENERFPQRPSNFTSDQFTLVQQMCALDPSERVSINEVVDRLYSFRLKYEEHREGPDRQASFSLPGNALDENALCVRSCSSIGDTQARRAPVAKEIFSDWNALRDFFSNSKVAVRFTVSAEARNKAVLESVGGKNRTREGDILPDGWVAYKRTYRCSAMDRCGGLSDDRDYQLCPCEVVAKSVKVGGKWCVKIMRVCWHNHPLDDLPSDGNRARTAAKRRKIDGGSEAPAKSRCLHAQMTEHASCGVNTNAAGTPVTMLPPAPNTTTVATLRGPNADQYSGQDMAPGSASSKDIHAPSTAISLESLLNPAPLPIIP